MYLTKMRTTCRDALRLLAQGAYEQHRLLWRLFDEPPGQARDFLFRRVDPLDADENGRQRRDMAFYVLSMRQPMDKDGIWLMQTKPFSPKLVQGERLAFSLRVNPVRARREPDPEKKRGRVKRDDVVMCAKQEIKAATIPNDERPSEAELVQASGINWLRERAGRCGFSIGPAEVRADGYRQHWIKRAPKDIRFSTIDFEGRMTVTDPQALLNAMSTGIGPAKAFGCGLLLIRRA